MKCLPIELGARQKDLNCRWDFREKKSHWYLHRPRAFTLIELLTCVAIIAILAGMILLGMHRARDYARRAWCVSNLHQIGLGMLTYANDNASHLAPFYFIVQHGQGNGGHYKIFIKPSFAVTDIQSIGPVEKVMVCPSDDSPYPLQALDASGNNVNVPMSYMYNFEPYMTDTPLYRMPTTDILMFFDGDNSVNLQKGVWWGDDDPSNRNKDSTRFGNELFKPRHLGTGNVLFMDNHCVQLRTLIDKNGNFVPGVYILPP